MSKKTTLVFSIAALCVLIIAMCITASAATSQGGFALKFNLVADGNSNVAMANKGDVITVSFVMSRTDSDEKYATNGFQNYIHYDLSFFEFVEGSIVCNDTGMAVAKKHNSITHGEIIQCQNMGKSYDSDFVFCTFQLRVIGESGSGMVYNDSVHAFDNAFRAVAVEKVNLQIIIDNGCTHTDKTFFDVMQSSCNQKGWRSHMRCNGCEAVFDASGDKMIPGIPYIDEVHDFSTNVSYDKVGHWFECSICANRSEYSAHSGGVANCISKAECSVCGQEYGETDIENHTGRTMTKNRKDPWFWSDGYSGEVYCSDCGAYLEDGHRLSMYEAGEWPLWAWIIGVPLFPIVLIGWLIIALI